MFLEKILRHANNFLHPETWGTVFMPYTQKSKVVLFHLYRYAVTKKLLNYSYRSCAMDIG